MAKINTDELAKTLEGLLGKEVTCEPAEGKPAKGFTPFGDSTLRAEIEANPIDWLGAEHVARHGPLPSVLVKLLNPAQRLPVHVHPTRSFASNHLDCPYGKTEAWIILESDNSGGQVFVGTHRAVAHQEWADRRRPGRSLPWQRRRWAHPSPSLRWPATGSIY